MFISYQWDHQEEAIRVRQFLEEVTKILYMGFKHFLPPGLLCSKYFESRPDYLVGWTSAKWEEATHFTLGSTRFRSGLS